MQKKISNNDSIKDQDSDMICKSKCNIIEKCK